MNTSDIEWIFRRPATVDPADPSQQYYRCPHCGQQVDRLDPLQVVVHDTQHEAAREALIDSRSMAGSS